MNFFLRASCVFSIIITNTEPVQSKILTSRSLSCRTRVVLFDIDSTLFTSEISNDELKIIGKTHPECPVISFTTEHGGSRTKYSYVFLPYLKILFDYLIDEGVRIVFFSCDFQERNRALITGLLSSFWDEEEFEIFKELGQFDVFSAKYLFKGNYSDVGYHATDFKKIIRDGEFLSDVILVEDDHYFIAYDQKPVQHIEDLLLWFVKKTEKENLITLTKRRFRDFPLNSVYFMIGVFNVYFENEKCKLLPYYPVLPEKEYHKEFFERNPFAYSMIDRGLSEVQKQIPNAKFYGSRYHGTFAYSFTFSPPPATSTVGKP